MDCFELKNLSFAYPEERENVLDDISLTINAGEFVVLCGPLAVENRRYCAILSPF